MDIDSIDHQMTGASSSAPLEEDPNVELPEETIAHEDTLQKYRAAAAAVQDTLLKVAHQAIAGQGKKIVELCELGDKNLLEQTGAFQKKKKLSRGIAFPTCINVNQNVCHYSPFEDDTTVLKEGDVVRIDCGAHIDGYIAVGATTLIVGSPDATATGRAGDALAAASLCVEAAMRVMKPGHRSSDVSVAISKIAADFGVEACEGVLSHRMKRFIIDGQQSILQKPTLEQQTEEFEFQENQVYSLDICLSTGAGKLRESTVHTKPFIYKRVVENNSALKRDSARKVFDEIEKFETMPFAVRYLDKKTGKLGIIELYRTGIVEPYPILAEKAGEFVAHIKTTVFISSSAVTRAVTVPTCKFSSSKAVADESVKKLLAQGLKIKKASKSASSKADKMTDE